MSSWLAALLTWWSTVLGTGDADPECLVLGRLDAVRALAYLDADPAALTEVYASRRLRDADAAVLRGWTDRGFRLEGMAQQRSSCRVLDRGPERLTLDVVDRLGRTHAVRDGRRTALPQDRPSRRTVVLTRTPDGWRVARVR